MENHEYISCFRVIIYALKMLGVFPFILLHRGTTFSFLVCKMLTLFSVLLYVAVQRNQAVFMYYAACSIIDNFNFTYFVRNIPPSMFRITLMLLPVVSWNKNSNLYSYWSNWMYFQRAMENTTGRPFSSSTKGKINVFSVSTAVLICGCVVIARLRVQSLNTSLFGFVANLYIASLWAVLTIYWFINNLYVKYVARQILELIRKAIRDNKATELRHLIDLWLMLCNMNDQFDKSHSILFLLYLTVTVVSTVACVYTFAALLFTESSDTTSVPFLYFSIICFGAVMAFCESANSVSRQIFNEMKKALLNEKIINRRGNLRRTIHLFLETIDARNPRMTVNGYLYSLNRSTITTIFAAVINFLVVLKQFSVM